jgi:hypothetical protein
MKKINLDSFAKKACCVLLKTMPCSLSLDSSPHYSFFDINSANHKMKINFISPLSSPPFCYTCLLCAEKRKRERTFPFLFFSIPLASERESELGWSVTNAQEQNKFHGKFVVGLFFIAHKNEQHMRLLIHSFGRKTHSLHLSRFYR